MREQRRGGFGGFVIVAVLAFIVAAVWWLESRFGANVAMMVLGGTLGIICFAAGGLLVAAVQKATLNAATDFNHDIAGTERYRQMTGREYARSEREAFSARAKLEVIDAKRIDQLAQQRAGLLVDLERKRMEEAKQLPHWGVDDEDDGEFQRYS